MSYPTILHFGGVIKSKGTETETLVLQKELNKVNMQVRKLREENRELKEELERIKNKMGTVFTPGMYKEMATQTPISQKIDTVTKKGKKGKITEKKDKSISKQKRNSQPVISPLTDKGKGRKLRRELEKGQKNIREVSNIFFRKKQRRV